jgi:outer membrane protein assembly factor BamD (BamD/ComL family)
LENAKEQNVYSYPPLPQKKKKTVIESVPLAMWHLKYVHVPSKPHAHAGARARKHTHTYGTKKNLTFVMYIPTKGSKFSKPRRK